VISGTPTSAGSGSYSVTATNSAGSTTASITITIAAIAPTLNYSGASGTSGQVNTAMSISPTSLTTGGASITNCTGSLPSGLSINTTNCVISGTPNSAQGATNHTITITNSSNLSSTATVSIAISAQLPTISFSGPSTGNVGVARTITPTTYNGGTNISNCTVSPALPDGLSINTSTCEISGTPSSPAGPTNHIVTIHNSAGTGNGSVSITVSGYVCSNHGYDGPSTAVNSLSNCWYNCSARGFDGGGNPNNLNSCYYSCSSRDLCGGNIFHPGSPSSCSNKVWAVVNQSCSNVQTCNQVITSYTNVCGTRLGYVVVQGTQLTSTQAGHNLCATHVGAGFSWLDFHGGGVWNGISAIWVNNDVPIQRGFVWIRDQPANCYWGSGKQLTFGCHSGGAGFWSGPDYGTASPYNGDVSCSSYRPLFCVSSGCYSSPVYTTQCTTNNVCNDVYGWTCN
jgi:hypothetical protein